MDILSAIYQDPMVKKAMITAYEAHLLQRDKGGVPYIFHPLTVAAQVVHLSPSHAAAALLHDVVEDTSITLEKLEEEGFSKEVLAAVALLTHEEGVPYMEYVEKIKENPIAMAVKKADLTHNMNRKRLAHTNAKDLERIEKYKRAYQLLSEE